MIIDASVAIKWFIYSEEDWEKAKNLLAKHLRKEEQIIVPDLLFLEISNTFATKKTIPLNVGEESLKLLYKWNLHIEYPSDEDLLESLRLAKKHITTVYDMLYAVLAKKLKTYLITADNKFYLKTKFSYVRLLSHS